jgi:branched-subunit amino acid transport protein AzlD
MFPILKQYNENLALGYLGLRIIEAAFCSVIVISPLSLIKLSQEFLGAGALDAVYFQTVGTLSVAERASVTGLLIPIFFSLGALLLYYLLYQSELLPRFISIWGLIAAVLILALNFLSLNIEVGIGLGLIFALPVILNEIFLAIWLIAKGFNPSAVASKSAIHRD